MQASKQAIIAANLGYLYIYITSVILIFEYIRARTPFLPQHILIESSAIELLLSLLLVVAHLLGLLQQLGGVVDSTESANGSINALVHEVTRNENPEEVHEHEVAPEVGSLRASVGYIEDVVVEQRSRVVQDVAIELAKRDDELQRVTKRVVDSDQVGGDEGEGSPEGLPIALVWR